MSSSSQPPAAGGQSTSSLTAGDIKLTAADVALLEPRCWLNDQLIAFFFEKLAASASAAGVDVLLLEPSIIFTASMLQDAAALRGMLSVSPSPGKAPLADRLGSASLVLMPVNDNDDPNAGEGGGHWSLLAFRRGDAERPPRFEHYDSCGGSNGAQARAVAQCLAALLLPGVRGPSLQLVNMKTALQANGFDCGVYVLCFAEMLCAAEGGADAVRTLTPKQVEEKRAASLRLLRGESAE